MPAQFFYQDPNAPRPTRPIRLGVVALIEHENALLMELRSDSPFWALIGGGVEMDESTVDAVTREVREETGLAAKEVQLFGVFSDPSRIASYPDGNVFRLVTIAYRVSVADALGIRPSHESSEVRLHPLNTLAAINVAPTHRHIVERYLTDKNSVVCE